MGWVYGTDGGKAKRVEGFGWKTSRKDTAWSTQAKEVE